MDWKRRFYQRYGAQEYVIYDPDHPRLEVWVRSRRRLIEIPAPHNWVSPLLHIRFDMSGEDLVIDRPDGRPFLTWAEMHRHVELTLAEQDRQRAKAEAERDRAITEAEKLRAKLRELGIDPDAP